MSAVVNFMIGHLNRVVAERATGSIYDERDDVDGKYN
jgi:hypothetical protein